MTCTCPTPDVALAAALEGQTVTACPTHNPEGHALEQAAAELAAAQPTRDALDELKRRQQPEPEPDTLTADLSAAVGRHSTPLTHAEHLLGTTTT